MRNIDAKLAHPGSLGRIILKLLYILMKNSRFVHFHTAKMPLRLVNYFFERFYFSGKLLQYFKR